MGRLAPVRAYATAALALAISIGADQATKALAVASVERTPIELGLLRLTVIRNRGASFSLFQGQAWMFIAAAIGVTMIVAFLLRRVERPVAAWGLGLVVGGAWGNIVDRLLRAPGAPNGGVVDFLDFKIWPVFNLADTSLVVGAGLLLVFGSRASRMPEPANADDLR